MDGETTAAAPSAGRGVAGLPDALAALRGRGPELIALTRSWVEVNSFSENLPGLARVGALLREAFQIPGLRCEVLAGGPRHGDHLLWRTPAASEPGARPILLIGHHDTVFPPGHFEGWRETGDRAQGPGTLDMKGGLAVIRGALAALAEIGALERLPIAVISVADEEVGSPSSAPHLRALAREAACALVFESGRSGDAIVTRRKGVGELIARASGRAAHAGNNHRDGANAIAALAHWIGAAQALTDYESGVTVSVGLVSGGTSKNTVPAQAQCSADLRFQTAADAEALIGALHAAAARAAALVPGTAIALEGGVNRPPLERSEASAALLREYAACALASGLAAPECPLVGGGSDANTVAPLGVPVIDALGPRGAGFHTLGEYVELPSFVPKAEALLRFLWGRAGL